MTKKWKALHDDLAARVGEERLAEAAARVATQYDQETLSESAKQPRGGIVTPSGDVRTSVAPSSAQIGANLPSWYPRFSLIWNLFWDAVLLLIVWTRSAPWWVIALIVTCDSFTHALRTWLLWEKRR